MSPPRSVRRALALVALCAVACPSPGKRSSAGTDAAAPLPLPSPAASGGPDASEGDASPRVTAPSEETSPVVKGRSVGHTSVVFEVTLANGVHAVWKPASRRGPQRYKGEIGAARLAECLGITNVPRATFASFDPKATGAALGATSPAAALLAREALTDARGRLRGALLPWIEGLTFPAFETEPLWSRWRGWLKRGADVPEADRPVAADASTMVAFDLLTGNWDRFSGGNVGQDQGGRLIYLDNDGAFYEVPPPDALARTRRILAEIDRFSRAFVSRLRSTGDDALVEALGEDPAKAPLFPRAVTTGLLERRRELVKRLDDLVAKNGEAETLFFP